MLHLSQHGVQRTFKKTQEAFYWPGINKDIIEYICLPTGSSQKMVQSTGKTGVTCKRCKYHSDSPQNEDTAVDLHIYQLTVSKTG